MQKERYKSITERKSFMTKQILIKNNYLIIEILLNKSVLIRFLLNSIMTCLRFIQEKQFLMKISLNLLRK